MSRGLYLLFGLILHLVHGDVITHFAQSAEIGVEQLPEHKGTDKVTFFAAMRAEKATKSEYNYLISFGDPECSEGCAQSMVEFCEEPKVEQGWEHFEIEHYPEANDPGAVYMRTTIALGQDLRCNTSSIQRTVDETTGLITFSGNLVLSIWTACKNDECPTFQRSDAYDFKLSYNASNREIIGMSYNLAVFEYSAEATRNIRMDDVGLMVEITTTVGTNNERAYENPPHFNNAVLFSQDCVPEMQLVAMTECPKGSGNSCDQQLYLLPVKQADSAYGTAKGRLEIHAQLIGPDGVFQSVAVLHVRMNIDSGTDYGTSQRDVDFLIATESGSEPDMLAPYIITQKTANLFDNQTLCVALSLPDPKEGVDLQLFKLIICSSASVDLSTGQGCRTENVVDMKTYTLFERSSDAETDSTEESTELSYCFQVPKINTASHVLDISYATAMTAKPIEAESSGVVNLLRRRSLYDNSVVTTQNFWVDCPEHLHWDEDCECCVHDHGIDDDDINGWGIFLLVLLGLGLIGTLICFWWWGTPGCSYGMDAEYMHPYYVPVIVPDPKHRGKYVHGFRDAYSGAIVTEVVVDQYGNRMPAEKHRHKKDKKHSKK
jgi:hypothetical protein